jgi:hypothetical protein
MRSSTNTKISAVYAIPQQHHDDSSNSNNIQGIALLLHACTHTSLKFFSSSSECTSCVGLSEELQIVRLVLEKGYAALAITCSDEKSGCWNDADTPRIQYAIQQFIHTTHPELFSPDTKLYAIGASSGGYMAAKLLATNIVDGALVMVMGLPSKLQDSILELSNGPSKSLYFAPMIKDKGTTKRVKENYNYLNDHLKREQSSNNNLHVVLDETSCQPLPVTADYLWNRVPNMTIEAARIIIDTFIEAKHIDATTKLLVVDPTKSNWRDFVLNLHEIPDSLLELHDSLLEAQEFQHQLLQHKESSHKIMLWNTFDLTPGMSPLAKALHRAWAYHEYCSEAVHPAIALFEKSKRSS